jgi:putative peptide zinc metalloprotease protein
VLIDLLDRPRLKEEAGAYFRRGLWRDLRHGRLPKAGQLALAVYGGISFISTIGFLLLGVYVWRTRLSSPIRDHVPAPLDQVIVVAGLVLLFFPVWYGPLSKLARSVRRRRLERVLPQVQAQQAPA